MKISASATFLTAGYDNILATGRLDRAITQFHATDAANIASIRKRIDVSFSRDDLDFGPGFYTTRNRAQAAQWASRFDQPTVLTFRVSQYKFSKLNGLHFDAPGIGWSMFVRANRLLQGPAHGFDVISGPVLEIDTAGVQSGLPISAWPGYDQTAWITDPATTLLHKGLQR